MAVTYDYLRAQSINYEIYDTKGNRLLGTATVDLPELKAMTNEVSGAGVAGKIDMPTIGMLESLVVGLNWRSINQIFAELSVQKAVDLLIYNAEQLYDHINGKIPVQQIKISLRGIPKNGTLGKLAPGEQTDSKNEIEVIYLSIDADKVNILKFDKINYFYVVNGVDYLKETRAALNLGDLGSLSF